MDGVLVDARELHYIALNKALIHFGYEISNESHLLTFDGLPTRVKLDILTKTKGLPASLHNLISALKQKYTIQLSHTHCKPNINHRKLMAYLKQEDIKIAVCSNSIRNTIVTMMNLTALEDYLDLIISNEDVSAPKPSPEMYTLAMSKLGLLPSECLVVEDSEHGIKAAKESGAKLKIVSSPFELTVNSLKPLILI